MAKEKWAAIVEYADGTSTGILVMANNQKEAWQEVMAAFGGCEKVSSVKLAMILTPERGAVAGSENYQAELYYGFHETDTGIYHAFEAVDPAAIADSDMVAERLAELLDTTVNDDRFDYNFMLISIPDSLVERIKEDAIREQQKERAKVGGNTIYTHDEAADILELFEDLLCAHGIKIPSPEDKERGEDNGASIYGSTYSDLLDTVEGAIIEMAERAANGAEIVEGEFSGSF